MSTSAQTWLIVAMAFAASTFALIAGTVMAKRKTGSKATGALTAKRPLTDREQAMYFRLLKTLPERVVLAQVAFSALLTTKDRATRATFDRKVADFVLCDKAFGVLAVIELDDASHKGRGSNDAARDTLLAKAGIKVIRFKNVPDADELLIAASALTPNL